MSLDPVYAGTDVVLVTNYYSAEYTTTPDHWPVPGLVYQFHDAEGPRGRCRPYDQWIRRSSGAGEPSPVFDDIDDGATVIDCPVSFFVDSDFARVVPGA